MQCKEQNAFGKRSLYRLKRKKLHKSRTQRTSICESRCMTLNDVLSQWIEAQRLRCKGATTTKYQNVIRTHIANTIGSEPIKSLTTHRINIFLQDKMKNGRADGNGGLAPSYIRSIVIVIQSALKFAYEQGFCGSLNVSINGPSIPKSPEIEVLSRINQEQLENYTFSCMTPTTIGILLSLQTGLRIGEVCALSWNDIDFEQNVIHVRHTIARVTDEHSAVGTTKLVIDAPKTQSSKRDIPISKALSELLQKQKTKSNSEYVVSESEGFTSPRTYDYRYHGIMKALGIQPVNYHILRHTFATRCVEAGVDVKTLSEILGHANTAVTLNTYVHSSLKLKRLQMEKIHSKLA